MESPNKYRDASVYGDLFFIFEIYTNFGQSGSRLESKFMIFLLTLAMHKFLTKPDHKLTLFSDVWRRASNMQRNLVNNPVRGFKDWFN